jgi:AcrR family transcriptional regulator
VSVTTGRERNPRGQGNLLRVELLAAVDRLVGDEVRIGPKWLSLREAAREAGIAAPSIYPHFASKERLIDAAITEGFSMLVESMRSAGNACGEDAEATDVLVAQARAYCEFADIHRGFFRLMFNLGPPVDRSVGPHVGVIALSRQWASATAGLHNHGIETTLSHDQLAMFIWSAVHGQITLGRALFPFDTGVQDLHSFIDTLLREVVQLFARTA